MKLVEVDDVIQCDPEKSQWGPVFVIVTELKSWGVMGYFLVTEKAGESPGTAYVRVKHGDYEIIGRAVWRAGQ